MVPEESMDASWALIFWEDAAVFALALSVVNSTPEKGLKTRNYSHIGTNVVVEGFVVLVSTRSTRGTNVGYVHKD